MALEFIPEVDLEFMRQTLQMALRSKLSEKIKI